MWIAPQSNQQETLANLRQRFFRAQSIVERQPGNVAALAADLHIPDAAPVLGMLIFRNILQKSEQFVQKVTNCDAPGIKNDLSDLVHEILPRNHPAKHPTFTGARGPKQV